MLSAEALMMHARKNKYISLFSLGTLLQLVWFTALYKMGLLFSVIFKNSKVDITCCGHPLSYSIKGETRDPNAKGKSHLGLLKQVNH